MYGVDGEGDLTGDIEGDDRPEGDHRLFEVYGHCLVDSVFDPADVLIARKL